MLWFWECGEGVECFLWASIDDTEWGLKGHTKENVETVEVESEEWYLASSSRNITVSSNRVATALPGWEEELAIPKGILFIEKWCAYIMSLA
jgi:hypothetical protein